MASTAVPHVPPSKRPGRRAGLAATVLLIAVGVAFRLLCGFYSIQPIGALPEGLTALVWRGEGEPFFNSPDAQCLRRLGYVSLLCRGMAVRDAPTDRIFLRLPYMPWAYRQSTDGKDFDR